jgi:hypothetical protein
MDLEQTRPAFGLGRTKAQEMAKTDTFPCRVLRVGRYCRVRKADLMRVLGFTVDGEPLPEASHGDAA